MMARGGVGERPAILPGEALQGQIGRHKTILVGAKRRLALTGSFVEALP
jgi:hypothetical protein